MLKLIVCDNCFIIRCEHSERKCPICDCGILRINSTIYKIETLDVHFIQDTYKQIKQLNSDYSTVEWNMLGSERDLIRALFERLPKYFVFPYDSTDHIYERSRTTNTLVNEMITLRRHFFRDAFKKIKRGKIDTIIRFARAKKMLQQHELWIFRFLQLYFRRHNIQDKKHLVACNNCYLMYRYVGQSACLFCGSREMEDFKGKIVPGDNATKEAVFLELYIFLKQANFNRVCELCAAFINSFCLGNFYLQEDFLEIKERIKLFRKDSYSLAELYEVVNVTIRGLTRIGGSPEEGVVYCIGDIGELLKPPYGPSVFASIFSPPTAKTGGSFLVQASVYDEFSKDKVENTARSADEDTIKRLEVPLFFDSQEPQKFEISLIAPGLSIDEPVQSCVWKGPFILTQFIVMVPEHYEKDDVICTVIISQEMIPLGHMKFKVRFIRDKELSLPGSDSKNINHLKKYYNVFISYASEDRTEVLKRVQMLQASRMNYFQDILSLDPGERWEKALYRNINLSDAFFLFWSSAAKRSEWVRKEIEYAMEVKQGKEENRPEIIPIIIEGPPVPEPPEELKSIHFNDRLLYFMNP